MRNNIAEPVSATSLNGAFQIGALRGIFKKITLKVTLG